MSILDIHDKNKEEVAKVPRKRGFSKLTTSDNFEVKKAPVSAKSKTTFHFEYCSPLSEMIPQDFHSSNNQFPISSERVGTDLGSNLPPANSQNFFFPMDNSKSQIILQSSNSISSSQDEKDPGILSTEHPLLNKSSSFPSQPIESLFSFTDATINDSLGDLQSPLDDLTKFDEAGNSNSKTKAKQKEASGEYKRAYEKFLQLMPFINSLTGNTFPELLLKIINENRYDIPLDDFYNLLYNSDEPGNMTRIPTDGIKLDRKVTTRSKLEGLTLCQLVIQTFQKPRILAFPAFRPIIKNQALYSLNFDEILRTFLAIKMMLDAIKIVNEPSMKMFYLSRISIYKVYYILCRKLMQKYQQISTASNPQNNIILSQPQFGKVLKLTFPNLIAKRLGRRGDSKFHYYGVIWNEDLIDNDIDRLAELSLQDLKDYFKAAERTKAKSVERSLKTIIPPESFDVLQKSSHKDISGRTPTRKPLYSFVGSLNPFPGPNCFLRSWEMNHGKIPQQSQWSREIWAKAVKNMKSHGFEMEFLWQKFQTTDSSREYMEGFIESIRHILTALIEVSAPLDAYLNFYLAISLLISPLAFASDEEASPILKENFRNSWTSFSERIEAVACGLPPFDRSHLMSFTNIIRKMICCNKLLTSRVPTKLVKDITSIMGAEEQVKVDAREFASEREVIMREVISKCALRACKALDWEFVEQRVRADHSYHEWFIEKFTGAYVRFCKHLLGGIFRIPQSMTSEDLKKTSYALSHKVFTDSVQNFHRIFISDEFVSKLPMKLIEFMVINITNEFQTINFRRFGQLDHELSKEIFKTWWVYSTAVQESTKIVSEVISLSLMVKF